MPTPSGRPRQPISADQLNEGPLSVRRARVVRCYHTAPHAAPNTTTPPIRMNQVRKVKMAPTVPYVLLSSMITDEKHSEENKPRPPQGIAVRAPAG